jgi:hypothetical protein
MFKLLLFLIGLGLIVVGLSSYFGGIPIPVNYSSSTLKIGVADFRVDITMIIFGILLMLLSMAITKRKM